MGLGQDWIGGIYGSSAGLEGSMGLEQIGEIYGSSTGLEGYMYVGQDSRYLCV